MKDKVWAWLLTLLQKRCNHPKGSVTADLMDGSDQPHQILWCRICGAYAHILWPVTRPILWTAPRASWWVSK